MLTWSRWWYSPILPLDSSFPFACRQTLIAFILAFSSHVSRKRPADVFLTFFTNSTSVLIVFLNELSNALMAAGANTADPADALQLYLEEHPDSNLANVLNRKEQEKKLRIVADDVLQAFLDSKAYNCEPMRIFLREILAGSIFESILKTCSQPDWINGWIVYLLEEGEPEIMSAISAGVGDATSQNINITPSRSQEDRRVLQEDRNAPFQKNLSPEQPETGNDDDATKMAMLEAKRLSEMIAAEEVKRTRASEDLGERISSAPSTDSLPTPTSSQSDLLEIDKKPAPTQSTFPPTQARLSSEAQDSVRGSETATTSPFTDFSQLAPSTTSIIESTKVPPLTLHNAKVVLFDDGQLSEKANLRTKPVMDYLLQIEPASSFHAGWMIARKYADFETLHEVLRRISVISGVPEFTQKYVTVPNWKGKTQTALRLDLEAYLLEALRHMRLAESEGMKRFLEKDQALDKLSNSKGLLGFPSPEAFQSVGKGMLDVLASAPKGAAGGGKALLEGVSGVFQRKQNGSTRPLSSSRFNSTSNLQPYLEEQNLDSTPVVSTASADSSSRIPLTNTAEDDGSPDPTLVQTVKPSPLRERPSGDAFERRNALGHNVDSNSISYVTQQPMPQSPAVADDLTSSTTSADYMRLNLPPPPSEISEDYGSSKLRSKWNDETEKSGNEHNDPNLSQTLVSMQDHLKVVESQNSTNLSASRSVKTASTPLTSGETQVVVELLFAVISELYTLSSVWSIRRTLLNAAKAFLLRPGNPSLEAIRSLLHERVIDENTSDSGIALQLKKLRENTMPTDEELAAWPPPLSQQEQEVLRKKARRLLVEDGMPPALKGVMGSSASSEALGRVFDSLQIGNVSRGLIFALMLQGVRTLTH